jgi:hypothetical protein
MIILKTLAVLYRYTIVVLSTLIVVKRYKYRDGYSLLSCLCYKLIYLARLVSLVCLLESLDPTTIRSVPVTCISSTAVDTQSTISIFRCPPGNSLGPGDPSITTSDKEHLPYIVWTVIYLSLGLG